MNEESKVIMVLCHQCRMRPADKLYDKEYWCFDCINRRRTGTPINTRKSIPRNSKCPCKSGKKFKVCCGST